MLQHGSFSRSAARGIGFHSCHLVDRNGILSHEPRTSSVTWRIPYMQRLLQYPSRWSLLSVGVVLAIGLSWQSPAPTQSTAKYPIVEAAKHKSYVEKIDETASFEMVPIPGGTFIMGS